MTSWEVRSAGGVLAPRLSLMLVKRDEVEGTGPEPEAVLDGAGMSVVTVDHEGEGPDAHRVSVANEDGTNTPPASVFFSDPGVVASRGEDTENGAIPGEEVLVQDDDGVSMGEESALRLGSTWSLPLLTASGEWRDTELVASVTVVSRRLGMLVSRAIPWLPTDVDRCVPETAPVLMDSRVSVWGGLKVRSGLAVVPRGLVFSTVDAGAPVPMTELVKRGSLVPRKAEDPEPVSSGVGMDKVGTRLSELRVGPEAETSGVSIVTLGKGLPWSSEVDMDKAGEGPSPVLEDRVEAEVASTTGRGDDGDSVSVMVGSSVTPGLDGPADGVKPAVETSVPRTGRVSSRGVEPLPVSAESCHETVISPKLVAGP